MLELESIGPPKLSDNKMGLQTLVIIQEHIHRVAFKDGCKNGMNGRNRVSAEQNDERL